MTGAEFRYAIGCLGLSHSEVANIFQVQTRTVRHWASDKDPWSPPVPIRICLYLSIVHGIDLREIHRDGIDWSVPTSD